MLYSRVDDAFWVNNKESSLACLVKWYSLPQAYMFS